MTSHSDAATELFESALECMKEGNLRMDYELFSQSLHREERSRTYFERARLHQNRDEFENASIELDRAVALCIPFPKDWVLLPKMISLRKQIASALEQERIKKQRYGNFHWLETWIDCLRPSTNAVSQYNYESV